MDLLWAAHNWGWWLGASHLCFLLVLLKFCGEPQPSLYNGQNIKFEKIQFKTARDGQEEEEKKMKTRKWWSKNSRYSWEWVDAKFSEWEMRWKSWRRRTRHNFSDILKTEKTQNILATNYVYERMNNLLTDKESFLGLWQERSNGQL